VFPQLVTGYSDSTAFVRELTLKCTLVVAPKLQQKTINQQLLKHLSKLQIDEEQVCVCVCVCSHCRVSPPTVVSLSRSTVDRGRPMCHLSPALGARQGTA
jgi:hypothetical protein